MNYEKKKMNNLRKKVPCIDQDRIYIKSIEKNIGHRPRQDIYQVYKKEHHRQDNTKLIGLLDVQIKAKHLIRK